MQRLKEIYGFDKPFYQAYGIWLWRVLHADLGTSDTYAKPVWDLMVEKFPISIIFGLAGFLLSYSICIPLGVWKAVKHGSGFDTGSSVLVFIAYSIPGWVAGVLLLMLLGGGSYLDWVPLGGYQSTAINSDSWLHGFLQKGVLVRDIPEDAIGMAQKLCKELSLGVGISGGANFLGCVLSGCNGAISVFADDNKKYLSTALADNSIHSQLVDEIELIGFEVL